MEIATASSLKWLPIVDADLCTSCAACVDECDPVSLVMEGGVPVVIDPASCTSCEECVPVCEVEGAMAMGWVASEGDRSVGKWS